MALDAYGAEHLVTANLQRLLGDALYNQDRFADAERHFREAAAVREKLLGPDHILTGSASSRWASSIPARSGSTKRDPCWSAASRCLRLRPMAAAASSPRGRR